MPVLLAAGVLSQQFQRSLYSEVSGANYRCYTEEDLFSASIPAALGANLINSPVSLHPRFLGIHTRPQDGRNVKCVLARTHNVAARWSQQNPSSGVFVDAGMKAWIDYVKSRGAQDIIWNLFHTPTWASARPTETGDQFGTLGALAEPASMASLSAYVAWVLQTYPDFTHIEFWNEPKYNNTVSSYFSGTATKLAEMARTVRLVRDSVRPGMPIMGVSATGLAAFDGSADTGIAHTNSFLAASDGSGGFGKDHIDILSVHTYMHDGTNNIRFVPNMKGYLDTIKASNGIGSMPVWCTEFGYITPFFRNYSGAPEGHLRAVARYALQHAAAGMERCIWYTTHSDDYDWPSNLAGDDEWNRWCSVINGGTITLMNRISSRGQLACVINGERLIV